MLFLFWILLAIIIGVVASKKGRSGLGYFTLSILFSPIISLLILLILTLNSGDSKNKDTTEESIKKDYISDLMEGKLSLPVTFWAFGIGFSTILMSLAMKTVWTMGEKAIVIYLFISVCVKAAATLAVFRSGERFEGNKYLKYAAVTVMSILLLFGLSSLFSHLPSLFN